MVATRAVLVVEDDALIGQVIQATLEDAGYEVVWREHGRDAVAAASAIQPACVLLDLMLPDMDGQEVLRNLKANPTTDTIPVVVVSAVSGTLRDDERALVQSVVPKPFTIELLVEAVRAAELSHLPAPTASSPAEWRSSRARARLLTECKAARCRFRPPRSRPSVPRPALPNPALAVSACHAPPGVAAHRPASTLARRSTPALGTSSTVSRAPLPRRAPPDPGRQAATPPRASPPAAPLSSPTAWEPPACAAQRMAPSAA